MARYDNNHEDFVTPVRRILVGVIVIVCLLVLLVWRIDNPRVERMRAAVIDQIVPPMHWVMAPVTGAVNLVKDFHSYAQLYQQNQELRRELQQMRAWREAALQLDQENARLLELNNVRLDPALTYITGVVTADSGSPFRQSVLLNVGARDGIIDGWAAMDGLGLVGRISGVGASTSRVLLLTDTSSKVPVTVQPSGQKAILSGDNTFYPVLDFLENAEQIRPGDRVETSGDGGLFPAGLLVGNVALGTDQRLRVRLVADYQRLEFLRVLRATPTDAITDNGNLLIPPGFLGLNVELPDLEGTGLPAGPPSDPPRPTTRPTPTGGGNG